MTKGMERGAARRMLPRLEANGKKCAFSIDGWMKMHVFHASDMESVHFLPAATLETMENVRFLPITTVHAGSGIHDVTRVSPGCRGRLARYTTLMNEECLICGAPLVYREASEPMECDVCHARVASRVCCQNGHFVCDECHTRGLDAIAGLCLKSTSRNPIEILNEMMDASFCHMHGPEHHAMVGAALLTAYRNAGGKLDLEGALGDMLSRGRSIPGGTCGFWGACGAAISSGAFVSIATGATPLTEESWGLANLMTSHALARIGSVGGPRCCKRCSYLAVLAAVDFARERLGVVMQASEPVCMRSAQNNQCIASRCPFFPGA